MHMDPVVKANNKGGVRTSSMQIDSKVITNEQNAAEKFDPSTIRLLTNFNKENKLGNPVSYQIIPFAGEHILSRRVPILLKMSGYLNV